MKNYCKFIRLIPLTLVFSLSACSSLSKMNLLRDPSKLKHELNLSIINDESYLSFKKKLNEFSSRLAKVFSIKKYNENKNSVISPLSVEMALGLALRSTNGVTRNEILAALGVDYGTFNQYYKHLYNELLIEARNENNKIYHQLLLSNSIWIDDQIHPYDETLDALKDDYYCYSYQTDFAKKHDAADDAIEELIDQQTKGLLKPNIRTNKDTIFLLLNTLYLKSLWNKNGDDIKFTTEDVHFRNANGKISSSKLLESSYLYGKTLEKDNVSAFKTVTKGDVYVYFIKPNEGIHIKDALNDSTFSYVIDEDNYIKDDDEKQESYYTKVIFPEFNADYDDSIKDLLIDEFNMKTLFNPLTANFSALSNEQAYCDDIHHSVKLEVNKKGLEGAAIPNLGIKSASGPKTPTYTKVYETFIVDEEFAYAVTYHNSILFSGIVSKI